MPDNLHISPPITGSTTNKVTPSPRDPQQIPVVDPGRVAPTNSNQQAEQNATFDFLLSRNSVYSTFIEQFRQTPALSQTLNKIMFDLFAQNDSLQQTAAVPTLMKQLASATEMDKTAILNNLLFQVQHQTKFSHPFFDAFRSLSKQFPHTDLDVHLASFLKAYDGVFSAPANMKSVTEQLNDLELYLPKFYGKKLQPLIDRLLPESSANNIQQNLVLLKQNIIPVLREYAALTKDSGKARDTISLLVHTLARLNTNSRENMVNKFSVLMDYCRYDLKLPPSKLNSLQELFAKCLMESSHEPENNFYDSFMSALSEGSKQNTSNLSQALYKDVSTSLLMDNSVYMPFTHVFLPVYYQGQFMFSEVWIEKEPFEDEPSGQEAGEKSTNLYITFDIKNLGYFEVQVQINRLKTSVHISIPALLENKSKSIRDSVSQIFTQNGMNAEDIILTAGNQPQVPNMIMKKIRERKDAIDVSI